MKSTGVVGMLWTAVSLSALACSGEDPTSPRSEDLSHEETTHWTYSGAEGPEYWGDLSEDYASCGSGEYQSPVDFPKELAPAELDHLAFDYAKTAGVVLNNGHTIAVVVDDASELLVNGEAHALLQFHFHAHSEHQVDGKHYPLEMHLVHASKGGRLAVVGFFFELGAENEVLAQVFGNMADSSDDPLLLETDLDLMALLPEQHLGWNYKGSLTTPPCTEGVNWNVHSTPLTLSTAQLEAFTDLHAGSYRPVGNNAHLDELLDEVSPN